MEEFVSTKEAARRLGVTVQHVRLLARKGQITAKQDAHGRWSFAADSLPSEPRRPRRHHRSRDRAPVSASSATSGSQGELIKVDGGGVPRALLDRADSSTVVELEREVRRLREENAELRKKLDQAKAVSELLGTASRLVDMLE